MISPYLIHIISLIAIYLIFAWSLNLAMGYTGIVHLGMVAFFGVGAYAAVLVDTRLHSGYALSFRRAPGLSHLEPHSQKYPGAHRGGGVCAGWHPLR